MSAYERGAGLSATKVLIKMADVFNVTLDYLTHETRGVAAPLNIRDREPLRRFEDVDCLSERENILSKEILDLVISKHRIQSLAVNTGGTPHVAER